MTALAFFCVCGHFFRSSRRSNRQLQIHRYLAIHLNKWLAINWDDETRSLLPRNLTWNPKMKAWKMFFLFKWVIFRFHVSFLGCRCKMVVSAPFPSIQTMVVSPFPWCHCDEPQVAESWQRHAEMVCTYCEARRCHAFHHRDVTGTRCKISWEPEGTPPSHPPPKKQAPNKALVWPSFLALGGFFPLGSNESCQSAGGIDGSLEWMVLVGGLDTLRCGMTIPTYKELMDPGTLPTYI